jgi:hypothetical protein
MVMAVLVLMISLTGRGRCRAVSRGWNAPDGQRTDVSGALFHACCGGFDDDEAVSFVWADQLYVVENVPTLREKNPDLKMKDLMPLLAQNWKGLTDKERKVRRWMARMMID